MKKFFMGIALVAVLACAASCGSHVPKATEGTVDSTAVDSTVVDTTAVDTTVVVEAL